MKVSIVTPSFRQSNWLKLCIASVADQEGVEFEHIVQDACSDDDTRNWLPADQRVRAFVEKDSGMYDAINRGLRRSAGEILAYLNCDEQYLPGALFSVAEAFRKAPGTDVVVADTVVVNGQGNYLCSRRSMVPWMLLAWTFQPAITSSIFFHRRVLEDLNLYFDTRWKYVADSRWMQDALRLGLKIAVLRRYTSAFADTGENACLTPGAARERRVAARMAPAWSKRLRWPLLQIHRLRSVANGIYWEKPFSYRLYTSASPDRRVEFAVPRPTSIWWQRHPTTPPGKAG